MFKRKQAANTERYGMAFTQTFTLSPLAPFNLALSAQIFTGLNRQVRSYVDGVYSQVLNVDGKLVLAKITQQGTTQKPQLTIELTSNQPLTEKTTTSAQKTIEYIFNLNLDLNEFYRHTQNDPAMHKITSSLCGFKYPTTPTAFESLLDSIVEQQISIKIARTIEERLAQKFGDRLELDGECFYASPTSHNIEAASINDIKSCGLSQRKAEYLYGAAHRIVNGELDLEGMKTNPNIDAIIAELDAIKGIGVWTAELTLFRGMQRLEVLPADDFGIRRVISNYYCGGRAIKEPEAREIGKAWDKWRGLAAFYLLSAEFNGVKI
jgi:DNA-3-methyladenine glycosylase II